jgi:hypothetical protein
LAKSNLEQIDVRLRTRSWATDVSGVYVKYSGRGASWDTLRAEDPRDGKIQFYLIAYRMGFGWRQWGPASYGDLDGLAVLEQPRYAVYASDSSFPTCAVSLEFRGDAAAVAQRGDCGFGYGVNINGNWERICAGTGTDCRDTPSGVPAR